GVHLVGLRLVEFGFGGREGDEHALAVRGELRPSESYRRPDTGTRTPTSGESVLLAGGDVPDDRLAVAVGGGKRIGDRAPVGGDHRLRGGPPDVLVGEREHLLGGCGLCGEWVGRDDEDEQAGAGDGAGSAVHGEPPVLNRSGNR